MAKNLTTGLQRGLRQSIAGGLGTGDLFSIASLDLQFARHKSLDSRVTHTRQSSATYVDGDGVIRTAVTNLLLQSEDFSTTWTTNGTCSVSPDQAVAPNGELTADEITVNNGLANHITQPASITSGTTYTLSAYVKAGTISSITLRTAIAGSDGYIVYAFATDSISIATPALISSASSVSLGNGWHRLSMQYTPTVSGTAGIRIGGGNTNNGTFYLWGAQLEESSTVGQYVKTTTAKNGAPRFDHDPTTGESLGLLVEESRQNLLADSEDVSAYSIKSNLNYSLNQVVAPDGTTTADKIYDNENTAEHYVQDNLTAGATGAFTHSVFVKAAEYTQVYLRAVHVGETSGTSSCVFDLSNETAGSPNGLGSNAVIKKFPNGWYRISLTVTLTGASTTNAFRVHLYAGSGLSYEGDGVSGVYLWGAQVEAGSFPTSYIPTEGSTVTRAADVVSITGTNFSSWYEQSEGTMFGQVNSPKGTVLFGTGNTFDNTLYTSAASGGGTFIRSGGAPSASLVTPITSTGDSRIAVAYKVNDFAASSNGGSPTTDISGAVPASQVRLKLGSSPWSTGSGNEINGTIRRLTYWPTRLSDDTLQTITV